ncbi:Hypothetical protein NTJ_13630 [Nesidiocoris tenuis]|uniref:Uncharacterized protein n=1 Tax=Nesidiocoris tenuis TaxID=355587 RepID=A0ABN7B8U7_9HEMI|nr:Hypothetical protein NTJ_13630 [Nesidiocoris tenuis]
MADINNKLCCWTYETWTKIIGFFETITGMLTIIFISLFLISAITLKDDIVIPDDQAINATLVINASSSIPVGITSTKLTETEYNFVIGYFVVLLIYQVAFTVLAAYLVIGVTRKNMKHVMLWVAIKTCLLLLALFSLTGQLVLTMFGYEEVDVWKKSIFLVFDALLIMIVYKYFKGEMEAAARRVESVRMPNPNYEAKPYA